MSDASMKFVGWVLRQWMQHDIGDFDGGDIQDQLEKLGFLHRVHVTEPCGEFCSCAEWDDFPQHCLQHTPLAQQAINLAKQGAKP